MRGGDEMRARGEGRKEGRRRETKEGKEGSLYMLAGEREGRRERDED